MVSTTISRKQPPRQRQRPCGSVPSLVIGCCFCSVSSFLLGRWYTSRTFPSTSNGLKGRRRMCEAGTEGDGISRKLEKRTRKEEVWKRLSTADAAAKWKRRLPLKLSQLAKGVGLIPRQDFVEDFDAVGNYGFPDDAFGTMAKPKENHAPTRDILVLYPHRKSMPERFSFDLEYRDHATATSPLHMNVSESLQNCQSLKTILIGNSDNVQQKCLALVPTTNSQEESFLVHRLLSVPDQRDKTKRTPLGYVGRLQSFAGRRWVDSINPRFTQTHWDSLDALLTSQEAVEDELRRLLKELGAASKLKTVVVLTCNKGQVELLMNFVCHASRRGFDVAQYVLVFATDKETKAIAQAMGLPAFYSHANFAGLPETAARQYGDQTFNAMMFAKVLCVYYINRMGYHVLFQDVDVIWYQNPLDLFLEAPELEQYDLIFQDDGAHTLRFSPSAGNTGFYFVRCNALTQYLMAAVIRGADVMLGYAHQQVFIAQVDEFASLYGLRVKTVSREDSVKNVLPGGFHYNLRSAYMKSFARGESTPPYIFHMHWTDNKLDKMRYYQQLGEWYLKESCRDTDSLSPSKTESLLETCCLPEPNITCHYGDKPSVVGCQEAKTKRPESQRFWSPGEDLPDLSARIKRA